jgi:hypothetical protein
MFLSKVFKFYFQNFLDICSGANVKKIPFLRR